MSANERQVGGGHYKTGGEEHWDRVERLGLDYFQGQITKYVERCWKKNGVQDLEKARHFLDKYIELRSPPKPEPHEPTGMTRHPIRPQLAADIAETLVQRAENDVAAWRELLPSASDAELKVMAVMMDKTFLTDSRRVAPSGWIGYVFEGADMSGFLFTCKTCAGKFYAEPHTDPYYAHECPALVAGAPSGRYVDQARDEPGTSRWGGNGQERG